MTKKQKMAAAKQIAKLEFEIQHADDNMTRHDKENQLFRLNESLELSIEDMIEIDEIVVGLLEEKEKG